MKKRFLSVFLALALCLTMLPAVSVPAAAAEAVPYYYYYYVQDNNGDYYQRTSATVTEYTNVTSTDSTWSGWMYATGEITIDDRVDVAGETHLILADGAVLTINGGIGVPGGSSLSIYGQANDTGKLTAFVPKDADAVGQMSSDAAIGGDNGNPYSGQITIHGGTISATLEELSVESGIVDGRGAGIGGGTSGNGKVTIYGGDITARGGGIAAAIGAGSATSNVTVYGGFFHQTGDADTYYTYFGGHPNYTNTVTIQGGAMDFDPKRDDIHSVTPTVLGTGAVTVTYDGQEAAYAGQGARLNIRATSGTLKGLYLLTGDETVPTENIAVESDFSAVMGGLGGYDFTVPSEAFTLVAVFDDYDPANYCTVTLLPNGGTGTQTSVTVEKGSEYTLPGNSFTAPDGAEFAGWSYTADGAVIEDTSITISGDTDLYAIWHTHSYQYAPPQDGVRNYFEEVCSCGHSATAEVNLPDMPTYYDGNPKTVTVTFDDNWAGGKNATIEYYDASSNKLNAAPINAGTYKFSVTVNNDLTYNGVGATFTIGKADATDEMKTAYGEAKYGASGTVNLSAQLAEGYVLGDITTAGADGVLNGTPVVNDDGVLSFAFADNADNIDETATITVPVASTNYNDYDITVTLTVLEKYEQTLSFAESTVTKTYGDDPFTITANHTVGDGEVTYSKSGSSAVEINPATGEVTIKKVDAIPVTITATAAATADYAVATAQYSLTIKQKELTIQPKAVTVKVNAAAPTFELAYDGLVSGESLTPDAAPEFKLYKSDGTTEITAEEAVKTAGTYIIQWTNMPDIMFTGRYENNYSFTMKETASLVVESSGGGGGGYTPPTTSVTIPISGNDNTINVDASVSGSKATVDDIDLSKLDTVIGEDVNTGVVTIDFSGLNKSIDTVEIPANVVKQISEAVNDPNNDAESLEVVLSDGTSIEFDAAALGEKAAQADGLDITISIENSQKATLTPAQRNAVGGNTAYDINVTSGGKAISDMGGMVTVHAPYVLKSGEIPRGVVVYYIDENGNKEACETSYDVVRQRVNWKTYHLSLYMIGYDEELAESCPKDETCPMAVFTDVDVNAWYHDGVHYAIENGLMKGTSTTENLFSPNGTTTRAQIVTILWRMEGEPSYGQGKSGTFADVPEYTWYTEAVEWAAANEIVLGYNGNFSPDDPITREQFAAILWRYAKYKGYDVSVGENTNILSYEDALNVSEYAIPAMQWACGAGIITGIDSANDGMLLDPQGNAIRSQAATIMMRFCENVTQ